jgi:2-polyprenyl-3-methyl-5-hydroxy-6-metoxy-1,4-benzoquinol methylase
METFDRTAHWQHIYDTKALDSVSWYQAIPETSLAAIGRAHLPKSAQIIDIGGGDSFLADYLLADGYEGVSVLDISGKALTRAQERLIEKANKITWIQADAAHFSPTQQYDLWHDRASFHFLTEKTEIKNYLDTLTKSIAPNGWVILGTFSKNGPSKCSGIPITQYSTEDLEQLLPAPFKVVTAFNIQHPTPFNTLQEFSFCVYQRIE